MLRPYFPTHIMSGYQIGAPLGVAFSLPWPSPRPSPRRRWRLDSRFRGNDERDGGDDGNDRHHTHLTAGRARRVL